MLKLIESSSILPLVDTESVEAYKAHRNCLLEQVNTGIKHHPGIKQFLTFGSMELLHNKHRNHFSFISLVMMLNDYEMLARNLPWVYRAYHNQGVDYDYFVARLELWIDAIQKNLSTSQSQQIIPVYRWMLMVHEQVIELSLLEQENTFSQDEQDITLQKHLLGVLLQGNHRAAFTLFEEHINNWEEYRYFFNNIVYPTMVKVGIEWENGNITPADEHLATAIIYKILSYFYFQQNNDAPYRGVAVVSAAPNEFHEMGAWMVANDLEMDGWEVKYLGANTPKGDLLSTLRNSSPSILALSAALPMHLDQLIEIVAEVKSDVVLKDIAVMVGGHAFDTNPGLFKITGADIYLKNSFEAVMQAREWQN